jgi:hypothetical protein
MKLRDRPDVFGYTTFCDDIRQEAGGLVSLIGVYRARMFVHGTFPISIPKFGFAISYWQRRELVLPGPIRIRITLPGDTDEKPSIETELPADAAEKMFAEEMQFATSISADTNFAAVHANFILAPLVFNCPGIIRVRAVRGDELVRLGSLRVLQGTATAEPPAAPAA